MHCNSCVIAVCGIPGSGKTSFSAMLKRELETKNYTVAVSSFDDHEVPAELWDEKSFEISRQRGTDNVASLVGSGSQRIVIVDDIMFYRSMRREIYKIARENHHGFVSIFMEIPIEVALDRNSKRGSASRVANESLINVHSKFEIPEPEGWESESITIDGMSTGLELESDNQLTALIETKINEAMEKVNTRIYQEKEVERTRERERALVEGGGCDPLQLNALDAALRKVVAAVMKSVCSTESPLKQHKKIISPLLSSAKQKTLQQARETSGENGPKEEEEFICMWIEDFREMVRSSVLDEPSLNPTDCDLLLGLVVYF